MVTKLKRVKAALQKWRKMRVPIPIYIGEAKNHHDDIQTKLVNDLNNMFIHEEEKDAKHKLDGLLHLEESMLK